MISLSPHPYSMCQFPKKDTDIVWSSGPLPIFSGPAVKAYLDNLAPWPITLLSTHSFFLQYWCCSISQSFPTLCDPMDWSTQASLSLTISQSVPKCMSIASVNAIQPSHPLTPSSPSALNLSQHEGLFQWVACSHQMTKILELQHQSFQQVFRADFPSYWLVWSPCCPGDF